MAKIVEATVEGNVTTIHTMRTLRGTPKVGELARIKATGKIHEVTKVEPNGNVTLALAHTMVRKGAGEGRLVKVLLTKTYRPKALERVIVVKVEEIETEPTA